MIQALLQQKNLHVLTIFNSEGHLYDPKVALKVAIPAFVTLEFVDARSPTQRKGKLQFVLCRRVHVH